MASRSPRGKRLEELRQMALRVGCDEMTRGGQGGSELQLVVSWQDVWVLVRQLQEIAAPRADQRVRRGVGVLTRFLGERGIRVG